MPDPTVIIILDSAGVLRVEAPGFGSAPRDKIEGLTLDQLPAEIQSSLIAQRDRIAAAKDSTRRLQSVAERPDPERERRKRNEAIAAERITAYHAWLDTLPPDQRAYQLDLQRKRDAAARHKELCRAHDIWITTATNHSIDLANRVISDPKRRPKNARPSKSAIAKAKTAGKTDLTKLREGIDYKVYTW